MMYSIIFICLIKTIISSQSLSNLIIIGSTYYRFISINSNQYNDLIILVTQGPGTGDRLFYGLKNNGRFLFKSNDDNEYPYKYYLISGEEGNNDQKKHHGDSSFIRLYNEEDININGNEYFLCYGKGDQYAELYNFDENVCTNFCKSSQLFQKEEIFSHNAAFIKLQNQEIPYLYLIAAITKTGTHESGENFYFELRTFYFPSINVGNFQVQNRAIFDSIKSQLISCFETELGKIICIHRSQSYDNIYYSITIFECCFDAKKTINYNTGSDEKTFYKGIHLKEEIAVFMYFLDQDSTKPYIAFKIFPDYTTMDNYNSLEPNLFNFDISFNNDAMLNDLLKISDTKICYVAPSVDKLILYVSLITLVNNDTNVNIRYYTQLIYEENNYMIFKDLKLALFNNQFITLGLSLCNTTECEKDEEGFHFASFIIFNYPNSTDEHIDLLNLLDTTNEEITNMTFNLEEYTKIENNLVGYVLKGIKILSIPEKIKLISTNNQLEIEEGDILSKDENFTLNFDPNDIIEIDNYTIEYALVITEGDYDEDTQLFSSEYYFSYQNLNGNEMSEKGTYIGKTSYFTIGISKQLTSQNCNDNYHYECSICLYTETDYCVSCRTTPYFEGDKRKCKELIIPTTLPILTTIPSTILSTILTTIPSTILSTIPKTSSSSFPEIKSTMPIQLDAKSTEPEQTPTSTIQENLECTNDKILENKCNDGKMTEKQIENIHDNLVDNLKGFNDTNTIISTQNVVFQVSTLEQQKNNIFSNISSIDLGDCEDKIKKSINGLSEDDNLIIIKTDIKDEETKSTYVQYEVYNPINLQKIDLSICENKISISVPVYLDENIEDFTEKLNNYGYNIFNENDSFYNDICSKFTEDGKDVTLNDRRNEIYELVSNISLCQKGCNLEYYNSTTKKAKCNCDTKNDNNFISDINAIKKDFFSKEGLVGIFSKGLMSSNFMVLKCYKLAISFKDHINNYGCIIISILLLLFIIFFLVYIIRGNIIINNFINKVLQDSFPSSENNKKGRIQTVNLENSKNKKTKEKIKEENKNKKENKIKKEDIKEKNKKEEKKKDEKKKKSDGVEDKANQIIVFKSKNKLKNAKNKIKFPPKKNMNIDLNKNKMRVKTNSNESKAKLNIKSLNNNLFTKKNSSTKNNLKVPINNTTADMFKKTKNKLGNDLLRSSVFSSSKINIKAKKKENNHNKYKNLNDQELNTLDYKLAIKYDKRTYFQYYCSLIKKKHIICFAFIPNNDYNVMALKISLLLISFSLYFTVNGFFFTDDTMHSIYVSEGATNIFNQISIIFYSFIVSLIVQQTLRLLCLSESDILNIKSEKDFTIAFKKSKSVKKCLSIKFIIFYILGFVLMLFFWYFITCFCAVFHNTQLILTKDTFVSFGISLLYPFAINLLPGIFRISAIRSIKKDKKCIYKFGLLVALF